LLHAFTSHNRCRRQASALSIMPVLFKMLRTGIYLFPSYLFMHTYTHTHTHPHAYIRMHTRTHIHCMMRFAPT